MSNTTHECPAPGCEEQVPFYRLACRGHWYMIPSNLRSQLLTEYTDSFGERSYFEARADCLAALGVPEHEIPGLNSDVGRRGEAMAR